jgi:hypothetical protein
MNDSRSYRSNAADCLSAAHACRTGNRGIHLSMAISWLSLARQNEARGDLLASWEAAKSVKTDCVLGTVSDPSKTDH